MDCSVKGIVKSASCFQCIPQGLRSSVKLYLLCHYASCVPPLAPTNLTASNQSTSTISLTWTEPLGIPPINPTGYTIKWGTSSGNYNVGSASVGAGVFTYQITGLAGGTTYFIVVVALNGANCVSPNSAELSSATLPSGIVVDAYTPLNDTTAVLGNGTVNDTASPGRVYSAPNSRIISGTGTGNITPVADYHTNQDPSQLIHTVDAALHFAANQQFTMFAWVKWSNFVGFTPLCGNYNDVNSTGWYMGLWVTNYAMRGFDNGGVDTHFDTGVAPVNGTWTFVAGGYDGTNLWMQINAGTRLTQALAATRAASNDWTLGNYAFQDTTRRSPDGLIGGIGLALRTLSTSDITNIYNAGVGQLPAYFT